MINLLLLDMVSPPILIAGMAILVVALFLGLVAAIILVGRIISKIGNKDKQKSKNSKDQ